MCPSVTTAAADAFRAFDKKGEDRIKVGDIENAMKKMGHTFKSEFLEKLDDVIDTEGKIYVQIYKYIYTPFLKVLYLHGGISIYKYIHI